MRDSATPSAPRSGGASRRYRTIVVDPPWHYDGWTSHRTPRFATVAEERKPLDYPSMSVEEIAALPIGSLAEEAAHLYLWTTNRYLPQAFGVVESWGFRYAQMLVWAKTPRGRGPGGAFAQNAEYVLFCRRGVLASRRRLETVWFNWRRTKSHSVKPDAMLDMVEQVSPGPYLEMFARRARFNWDYWGDESLGTVELPGEAA